MITLEVNLSHDVSTFFFKSLIIVPLSLPFLLCLCCAYFFGDIDQGKEDKSWRLPVITFIFMILIFISYIILS